MTPYEQLLSQVTTQSNAVTTPTGEFPSILQLKPTIIDGDTIRSPYGQSQRMADFDTLESISTSDKAKKIADNYGLSLQEQHDIGLLGKDKLKELYGDGSAYPMESKGGDFYNRDMISNPQLAEEMINTGYAVPTDRYNTKLQNLYRSSQEKKDSIYNTTMKKALEAQRDYNLDATTPSLKKMLVGDSIDALQSGTVRLLADTGDFALDAVTFWGDGNSSLLDEAKKQENIDKWVGYDRREAEFRIDETYHNFKQGNYLEGVVNMLPVAPQIMAESLPMMIGMVFGAGKFTTLGKAMKAANSAQEATKMKNMASLGEKMKYAIADNAGFETVYAGQVNNRLEERQANQEGADLSPGEVAGVMAEEFLMLGLDRFAFENIVGIKKGKEALIDLVKLVPDTGKAKLAAKLAESSGRIVGSIGLEAGQEFVQEFGNALGAEYGTKKYGDEIVTDARIEQSAKAAIAGGAAGGFTRSLTETKDAVADMANETKIDETTKLVKEEADKKLAAVETLKTAGYTEEQINAMDGATIQSTADSLVETPEEAPVAEKRQVTQEHLDNVISAMTTDLKAKGKSEQEIADMAEKISNSVEVIAPTVSEDIKSVEDTDSPMVNARMATGITKEMKLLNLNVEVDEPSRTTEMGGKKPKAFSVAQVKDEDLINVAEGKLDVDAVAAIPGVTDSTKMTQSLPKKLAVGTETQGLISKVYDTVKSKIESGVGVKELSEISDDVSPGRALRVATIVGDVIRDGISSEYDVTANLGKDNKDVDYARSSSVAIELGKRFFNSYGMKIAGDADNMNVQYARIGNRMLKYGEAIGIIAVEDKNIPALKLVDKGNKAITTPISKRAAKFKTTTEGNIQEQVIRLTDGTGTGSNYESEVGIATNALAKLLKTFNEKVPENTPTKDVQYDVNTVPDKKHIAIVQKLQQLEYKVKEGAMDVLRGLHEEAKKYPDYDYFFKSDIAKQFLGSKSSKSWLTKSSDQGRTTNRQDSLRKVFEAMDNEAKVLDGEFTYSYEIAVNERIHVMETVMEFQGDKYMARQMITGGEYTTEDKNSAQRLIEKVAEELFKVGSTQELLAKMEELKNPVEGSNIAKVVEYMKEYTKDGNKPKGIPLQAYLTYAKLLGIENPFKAMSLAHAIYDIATAEDKTKITTEFMPESDMTASGVINTLFNLSGIPSVAKILKEIVDKDLDPYAYVSSKLVDVMDKATYKESVAPTLAKLSDMGISMRDSIKFAVMPWFYGSAKVADNMANDLAIDIVKKGNKQSIAYINEILGTKFDKDVANKITRDEFNTLAEHLKENLSSHYQVAIEKIFPDVVEYRNKMGRLFDILTTSTGWDGKIGTAMMALQKDTDRKHRMSVKKDKQTPLDVDGVPVIMSQKFNNRKSFFVNLQHAVDAAQLMMSISRTLGMEKYKDRKAGIMTVHDAEYADSNILGDLEANFEPTLKESAIEYDFLQTAIDETLWNLRQVENPTKSVLDKIAEVEAMSEANKEVMKAKKEFLTPLETNFFGSKTIGMEVEIKSESKPEVTTTPTEVETKPEAEVKPKSATPYKDAEDAFKLAVRNRDVKGIIEAIGMLPISDSHIELKNKILAGIKDGVTIAEIKPSKGDVKGMMWQATHKMVHADLSNMLNPVTLVNIGTERTPIPKGVGLNADTLVEVLAHEMEHAITHTYIEENLQSVEAQYILKAVDRIKDLLVSNKVTDKYIRERLQYIVNPLDGRTITGDIAKVTQVMQVSEFIAIMKNEPYIGEYLAKSHYPTIGKIQAVIDRILVKIKEWVSKNPDKVKAILSKDASVTYRKTIAAMELLSNNAKVANLEAEIENIPFAKVKPDTAMSQIDVYRDASMNPLKYAEGIIARQNAYLAGMADSFVGNMITIASPIVLKGHKKLVKSSDLYASTTSKIRTGFAHSDIAQRFKAFLSTERDVNNKLINEMLFLSDSVTQEIREIETTLMPELDRRVNNIYKDKKDRVKVYELFGKTAIAGIQYDSDVVSKFLDGTLNLKEAIKEVSASVNPASMEDIDNVAKYYATGVMTNGITNLQQVGILNKNAQVLVALKAMEILNLEEFSNKMDKKLKDELYRISLMNKALNDEINIDNVDYDGHYSMDVHEALYEYRLVSKSDMINDKYSSEAGWKVVQNPEEYEVGVVTRELIDKSNTPGVGLNINRYENGFYVEGNDADAIRIKLKGMKNQAERKEFLHKNNLSRMENGGFRIVLSEKVKVEQLRMKQSVAHSLYRTYAHNSELLAMQSVRDIAVDAATEVIHTQKDMDILNNDIAKNKGRIAATDKPYIMPMFLNVEYDYEAYDNLPIWVKRYYKVARNVSTFRGLNSKITLVKRGESEILLGHPNFSPFSGDTKASRTLAKSLSVWKEVVVFAKQKMAVANAGKLSVDIISNMGILATKDVGAIEAYQGMKKGWDLFSDFNKLRSELVSAKVRAGMGDTKAIKEVEVLKRKIEKHEFYPAFQAGFVQSYSTQLIVKDFDTISGLQRDIDDIIESLTKDKEGNPNEVFNAIKKWQEFGAEKGLTIDALLRAATTLSKQENTTIGKEIVNMADRLKAVREDKDSVSGYIGNIIGSPSSEAMVIGGAVMVTADVLSKYTLAESLKNRINPSTKAKYTAEEAYTEANETFIDYRKNIPSEIKAMSDMGILMFPSFWLKAQKVIVGLVHYHPATALSGYMVADMLDMNSASFLDVNIANKIMDGTIFNDPTGLVDWDLMSPFL